ncbi:kinase [Geomicrobium sp. JCM 19037]|uniref:N-acetylglucosamine kinase n=1 Tax=Geomicrobium sp. JCM 19037 TaxID=1460634 RepID=UPI00045F1C60|nr:BadF/BadG/BcrA/BcrD ATPase family protein [Geomicrobium sp. JCM 19037]GAK03765.1 kinase [Geomicrobium sp. JCM 19037]
MLHSLIAIDGGGTKTAALLVDGNGNVQAEALVSATNPNSLSEEVVQSRIEALLTKLKVQAEHAYEEVRFVFAGMAGGDREPAKTVFKEAIRHHFSVEPTIYVDHDAVTALYSGTYGQPGIASIAGTGSIVFGVNEYGDRDRLGGWGYLLEDAGSGFELGRQAVLHCMNEFDLKRVPSPLSEAVLAHFQVERANELISLIYEPGKTRERIAPLSEQVCNLAVDGQPEAERIVREPHTKTQKLWSSWQNVCFNIPPTKSSLPAVCTKVSGYGASF